MADETRKNIQDVEIGDILKGETGNNTVLAFHRPLLGDKLLYSYNGGEHFVTAEHPFMTTDGWKAFDPELAKIEHNLDIEIGQLALGDTLITENGNVLLETVSTQSDDPETQLYNFILDGDKTYYADGYLVHNKVSCAESGLCTAEAATCYDPSTGFQSPAGNRVCSLTCDRPGRVFDRFQSFGQPSRCAAYGPNSVDYCGADYQRRCTTPPLSVEDGIEVHCSSPQINDQISCESQFYHCSWERGNNLGPSAQSRSVECQNEDGDRVSDNFCLSSGLEKPETHSTALCPVVTGQAFVCGDDGEWDQYFDSTGSTRCSLINYIESSSTTQKPAGTYVCSTTTPVEDYCLPRP